MSDSTGSLDAVASEARRRGGNGDAAMKKVLIALLGILGGAIAIPLIAVEWCRLGGADEVCQKEVSAAKERIQKLENAFEFQSKVLVEQKALLDDARREQAAQSRVLTRIETKLERLEPR